MRLERNGTSMNRFASCARLFLTGLLLAGLSACSVLPKPKPGNVHQYLLESPAVAGQVPAAAHGPVLVVAPPQAEAALNTARMAYVTRRYGIRYFAHNRWVAAPAHMLEPLMISALQASGGFAAVMAQPASTPAQLRLDTTLIRFQQDFTVQPSRLEVTLRARLTDLSSQRVLATRVFHVSRPAAKADPYAGVVAANEAVKTLLKQLTQFCVEHGGGGNQ